MARPLDWVRVEVATKCPRPVSSWNQVALGMQPKVGVKFFLRLNAGRIPIVKYCKKKMKTL